MSEIQPIQPVSETSCYRVFLRQDNGLKWGPIVVAASEAEAQDKARVLMKGCEPVEARLLHRNPGAGGGLHPDDDNLLSAKTSQALLIARHARSVGRLDRRHAS